MAFDLLHELYRIETDVELRDFGDQFKKHIKLALVRPDMDRLEFARSDKISNAMGLKQDYWTRDDLEDTFHIDRHMKQKAHIDQMIARNYQDYGCNQTRDPQQIHPMPLENLKNMFCAYHVFLTAQAQYPSIMGVVQDIGSLGQVYPFSIGPHTMIAKWQPKAILEPFEEIETGLIMNNLNLHTICQTFGYIIAHGKDPTQLTHFQQPQNDVELLNPLLLVRTDTHFLIAMQRLYHNPLVTVADAWDRLTQKQRIQTRLHILFTVYTYVTSKHILHNDLHTSNIMFNDVDGIDPQETYLVEETVHHVPAIKLDGKYCFPVIIDWGLATENNVKPFTADFSKITEFSFQSIFSTIPKVTHTKWFETHSVDVVQTIINQVMGAPSFINFAQANDFDYVEQENQPDTIMATGP